MAEKKKKTATKTKKKSTPKATTKTDNVKVEIVNDSDVVNEELSTEDTIETATINPLITVLETNENDANAKENVNEDAHIINNTDDELVVEANEAPVKAEEKPIVNKAEVKKEEIVKSPNPIKKQIKKAVKKIRYIYNSWNGMENDAF